MTVQGTLSEYIYLTPKSAPAVRLLFDVSIQGVTAQGSVDVPVGGATGDYSPEELSPGNLQLP